MAIANTKDLFRGSSKQIYVPAFTTMKDSHKLHLSLTTRIPQDPSLNSNLNPQHKEENTKKKKITTTW